MSQMLSSPPLGWNSFDSFGGYLHEEAAFAQLEAFAEKLGPAGYEYFVVDIGWYGEYHLREGTLYPDPKYYKHAMDIHLDEFSRMLPSKCYFPNGFAKLVERAHELGLKFGVHIMRGIPRKAVELNLPILGSNAMASDIADQSSTCPWCHYNYGIDMSKEGSQAYYDSLVALLAEWGVDFIKADDITGYPDEVEAFATAIERSGRPIVLSLSHGGESDKKLLPSYRRSDMLRITKDIWDDVESIDRSFVAWEFWADATEPGFWPDLDMIPFGDLQTMNPEPVEEERPKEQVAALCGKGWQRSCGLTLIEKQTFMTQRAMSATPLMPGGDNVTLPDEDVALLTNPKMLECNQNGVCAQPIYLWGDAQVWHAASREDRGKGWLGVFNRNPGRHKERIQLSSERIGLKPTAKLYDIWNAKDMGALSDEPKLEIPPVGVYFIEYTLG